MEKKVMRRKWMFFSVLILSVFRLGAQSAEYAVYKVTGTVLIKNSEEWQALQKRDVLAWSDVLRIEAESEVQIIDRATNRIYKSFRPGEFRVGQVIDRAKKDADRMAYQVNKAIFENMKRQDEKSPAYSRMGVTVRGDTEQPDETVSVYGALQLLIDAILSPGAAPWARDPALALSTKPLSDDIFHFVVENKHDIPLCVNILKIDRRDKSVRLCLDFGYTYEEPYILVPAGKSLILEDYIFVSQKDTEEDKAIVFVLFASPVPFDSQSLRLLLASKVESRQTQAVLYSTVWDRP